MQQTLTQILLQAFDPSPKSKQYYESFSTQAQSARYQNSPTNSIGSGKASPQVYHSPQINTNKQKLSKFLNESTNTPALKNRILIQSSSTKNTHKGSNSLSFVKQLENTLDNSLTAEFDQRIFTPRQTGHKNSINSHPVSVNQNQLSTNNKFNKYSLQSSFGFQTIQNNNNIKHNISDHFLSNRNKIEDQITLPQIQPQSSIKQVKKQQKNHEDKNSFFNQVNKYARKSLCAQQTNIDYIKKVETVPDSPVIAFINNTLELQQSCDNFLSNQRGSSQNLKKQDSNLIQSIKNSPQIKSGGRLSIFHENLSDITKEANISIKLDSDNKIALQSLQKISSLGSVATNIHSQYSQIQTQTRSTLNEGQSQSTFSFIQQKQLDTPKNVSSLKSRKQITSPFNKNQIFFEELIPEDSNPIQTVPVINNNDNNKQTFQIEKKDKFQTQQYSSFSSEDDDNQETEEKQFEIPKLNLNQRPQKNYLIRKMSDCVEQKYFFSPQLEPGNVRRRGTTQFVGGQSPLTPGRNSIQFRPINSDKESIFSNAKSHRSIKQRSVQLQSTSQFINSQYQQNETCSEDKSALLREFYYLLNEMKQYVVEQIEKNASLFQEICSFYMIQNIQEFSFHFGQFLDILAEQQNIKGNTFPYKFPKNIFSNINTFMHDFISKQPSNKEQLSKLLDEQLEKFMQAFTPSSQLEALGGYFKIKDMSEQIASLLCSSALSEHINFVSKEVTSKKVEEFLLAALNNDSIKVRSMIEEFKKHQGTGFLSTEFLVLKQIIFKFFDQNKYYSIDVKYQFFELVESLRYQIINEEGFSQNLLDSKQEALLKELQQIWRQDPILNNLKEISKNSVNQFISVVYDFAFLQKNCYQLSKSFQESFISANFDILIVKSLQQMIKVATNRQNITQKNVQQHLNYLFRKLQWFISNDNSNYVQILGDHQVFQQLMQNQFLNQNNTKENNKDSSSKEIQTHFNEIEKSNKSIQASKLNSNNSQSNQKSLFDISSFTQFITSLFNFQTTYHYSDLGSLFRIEKCSSEIFQFWITLFSDCLTQDLKISENTANEIKKFILDLFDFERIKQIHSQE